MKLSFYFVFFLILSISCSTGLSVYDLKTKTTPIKFYEPFRLFSLEDDLSITDFDNLGYFEFKDGGLTLDCSYSTVTNLAIEKAREIGANGIKITEHKYPDNMSSCHRIKGVFLYSENMWKYEDQIIWTKERNLEFRDFRDSTFNKDLVSTTMSGFSFQFKSNPIKGLVDVEVNTFFKPFESFINSTDTVVLQLQQLHFDASELYSRVYIDRILKECKSLGELEVKYQNIYNEVNSDLRGVQSEISNNAYRNIEERNRLMKFVKDGLGTHINLSTDTFSIPI